MTDITTDLQNKFRMLSHKIQLVFSTGRTSTHVDDSGNVRKVQVQLGYQQVRDDTSIIQQYGFASNPPPNSDVAFLAINGDRSVGTIIATNHQSYILKNIGDGSVALYDMFGNKVLLTSTGIQLSDVNSNSISMTSDGINITGANIVIHATQSLKYDADGNGTEFTSSARNDYVTGSTNTSHALSPPAIP